MRSITMTAAETAAYENEGPDGERARRDIRHRAQALANDAGKSVEIYSHDGHCMDAVEPA